MYVTLTGAWGGAVCFVDFPNTLDLISAARRRAWDGEIHVTATLASALTLARGYESGETVQHPTYPQFLALLGLDKP